MSNEWNPNTLAPLISNNNLFQPHPENNPCLHLKCTECKGTGVNQQGQQCIHAISCNCQRCRPYSRM